MTYYFLNDIINYSTFSDTVSEMLIFFNMFFLRDVLKHKELEEHINNSSIGSLLPEEDLKRLKEQYFSYKEVIQYMINAIRKWLYQ